MPLAYNEILKQALGELGRLAQSRRLRQGSPEAHARAFVQAMRRAIDVGDAVILEVAHEAISTPGGARLTDQEPANLLLCHALFAAGLRGLRVEVDVSEAELIRLVELLGRDWLNPGHGTENLVTAAVNSQLSAASLDILPKPTVEGSSILVGSASLIGELVERVPEPDPDAALAIGQGLQALKAVAGRATSWRPSQEESASAAAHPREFERLHRQLESIRGGFDVMEDTVNGVLFEALRLSTFDGEVDALIEHTIRHVRHELAMGRPSGVGLLRRPLLLLDNTLFPDWPYVATLQQALRRLAGEALWSSILSGLRGTADMEAWRGALFTVASAIASEDAGVVAERAGALPDRALLQAVADGLVVSLRRANRPLRTLLLTASDVGMRIALLAMSRSDDATVVENILSRFSSDDPRVREAVLVALRRQQSPRIKETARNALGDPTEAVRLEALRYLTVYRDAEGAAIVALRLSSLTLREVSQRELNALARALVHIRPVEGLTTLKTLAMQPEIASRPELAEAVLTGLFASGSLGASVLDEVGLAQPVLRSRIRAMMGGSR
ncbi:MAG: hypothetical protein AAFV53_09260 [Myxococcota bacterium]